MLLCARARARVTQRLRQLRVEPTRTSSPGAEKERRDDHTSAIGPSSSVVVRVEKKSERVEVGLERERYSRPSLSKRERETRAHPSWWLGFRFGFRWHPSQTLFRRWACATRTQSLASLTEKGACGSYEGRERNRGSQPPARFQSSSDDDKGGLVWIRECERERRGKAAGEPHTPPTKSSAQPVMILPQVHLRKPCYDFTFL